MANTTKTDIQVATGTGAGLPEKMVDNGDGTYSPGVYIQGGAITNPTIAAGESHLGSVGGAKVRSAKAFTRPANATAYTAKDLLAPAQLAVSGATNASPIVITTTAAHELVDGDPVLIASVGGNTNANGSYYAKVTGYSATTFGVYTDEALATPKAGNSAYTSGGTVDTILRWPSLARVAAGSGYIVKANLLTDQTTNTEGFKLHLFSVRPAFIADNAACTAPLYASAAGYIGAITFPAASTEGSGGSAAYALATPNTSSANLPLAFICGAALQSLYGILETPAGFTPASGQLFNIALVAEQD